MARKNIFIIQGTDRRGSRRWRKRRWWWRIGDNRECWSCRRLWWREGCDQQQGILVSSMQWCLCSSFLFGFSLYIQPCYKKSRRHCNLNTIQHSFCIDVCLTSVRSIGPFSVFTGRPIFWIECWPKKMSSLFSTIYWHCIPQNLHLLGVRVMLLRCYF